MHKNGQAGERRSRYLLVKARRSSRQQAKNPSRRQVGRQAGRSEQSTIASPTAILLQRIVEFFPGDKAIKQSESETSLQGQGLLASLRQVESIIDLTELIR